MSAARQPAGPVVTVAELAAVHAELAEIRDRLDQMARMAGIFYESGREDVLMHGQPRPDGPDALVLPFRRREGGQR